MTSTGGAARLLDAVPATAILIASMLLLQLGATLAKAVVTPDSVFGLLLWRAGVGALLLGLLVRPRLGRLTRTQWRDVCAMGAALAVMNLMFYSALTVAPLGVVATLGFLGPLAIGLFGARRALDVAWPLLAFAGVALLAPTDAGAPGAVSWAGLGFGLGFGAAAAAYILTAARAGRSIGGLDGYIAATVLAFCLIAPFGAREAAAFFDTPARIGGAIGVALLSVLPLALEFVALKRIEPRVFGVLLALEPGLATLSGLVLLDETIGAAGVVALLCVSVAAIGASLTRQPQAATESAPVADR